MESKHLTYFKVENFKRFESLEVNDIGQFNLIVGDNNVGKTSLLEALLFDDENFVRFLTNIENIVNNHHMRNLNENFYAIDLISQNLLFPIKYTFRNFGDSSTSTLGITKRLRSSLKNEEIDISSRKLKLYGDNVLVEFSLNSEKSFSFISEVKSVNNYYYPLIPFTVLYNNDIIDFFSKLSLSNIWLEKFKNDIRQFIPQLTSIEISNAYTKESLIILRESNKDISQPLSQYGDGVIKLFRYLLELDLCENKRLMLDEIDTGIHYSRMKEFLKKILQNAIDKKVQIFATTHSKECIKYYAEALEELGYQDEGRIIRLANVKDSVKAYTMKFAEFDDAVFADNEIR